MELFNNINNTEYDYFEVRDDIFEANYYEESWKDVGDVADYMVERRLQSMQEGDWDNLMFDIEAYIAEYCPFGIIISGTTGPWNKRERISKVCDSVDELKDLWGDCDLFEFVDEEGEFNISCVSSNGTNSFEMRRLTQEGRDYVESHWNDDMEEAYDVVMKNETFSELPCFAEAMYGISETA